MDGWTDGWMNIRIYDLECTSSIQALAILLISYCNLIRPIWTIRGYWALLGHIGKTWLPFPRL